MVSKCWKQFKFHVHSSLNHLIQERDKNAWEFITEHLFPTVFFPFEMLLMTNKLTINKKCAQYAQNKV